METIEERIDEIRPVNKNPFCKGFRKGYVKGATDQQAIFDKLPKMRAWFARDKDGRVFLYNEKPYKEGTSWSVHCYLAFMGIDNSQLPEGCNPKWTDEEPIEVELTINLKKG